MHTQTKVCTRCYKVAQCITLYIGSRENVLCKSCVHDIALKFADADRALNADNN
jgi:hypothetical protein